VTGDSRKVWTTDEDERLRQMVVADCTLADIAIELGRSEKAVKSRVYFLRLSLKRIGVARRSMSRWG
jgi:DNA-directed RNA polymerase specialized sigma24 family protein